MFSLHTARAVTLSMGTFLSPAARSVYRCIGPTLSGMRAGKVSDGQTRARTRSGALSGPSSSASVARDPTTSRASAHRLARTSGKEISLPHMDVTDASHPLGGNESDCDSKQSRSGGLEGEGAPEHDLHQVARPSDFPPSFAELEFETIVRRLRNGARYKLHRSAPAYPRLDRDWDFAGWGSLRYLDVSSADLACAATSRLGDASTARIGPLRATSVAGNAVFGSVFYSIPAIAAVGGVLSPLCMFFSCLTFLLYKPILLELGDAITLNGANYMYLLNFTSKRIALFGAAVTLLDAVTTGLTSAATAASYIAGEVSLNFPDWIIAVLIITLFSGLLLFGTKESTRVTLAICIFHCLTVFALVIASGVHWANIGSGTLASNWRTVPADPASVAKAVFDGICLGVLGVTGFESAPTYIEQLRGPRTYESTLRNLIWGAFIVNLPTLLVCFACLDLEEIQGGANVLALLADRVAGKWLRYVVVVDAVTSLCGGILTGGVAVTGLVDKLARDRAIPFAFHRPLFAASAYLGICLILYAATKFNLKSISNCFSMAFMATMFMFSASALFLKVNRNALRRSSRTRLALILGAMACAAAVILNVVVNDQSVLFTFGLALAVIYLMLVGYQNVVSVSRWALYYLDNLTWLRRPAQRWAASLIQVIKRLKQREICVWMKTDEISSMMEAVLYVRQNEQTARLLMIHAYSSVNGIPSELEANTKILDEAFPSITIDLILIHGVFSPELMLATSKKLHVPLSLNFVSGMRSSSLADYGGARIIAM